MHKSPILCYASLDPSSITYLKDTARIIWETVVPQGAGRVAKGGEREAPGPGRAREAPGRLGRRTVQSDECQRRVPPGLGLGRMKAEGPEPPESGKASVVL